MRFVTFGFAVAILGLAGCNTIGGLGKDVSEAGLAIDNAASWSQTQINEAEAEYNSDSADTMPSGIQRDNDF